MPVSSGADHAKCPKVVVSPVIICFHISVELLSFCICITFQLCKESNILFVEC
jgi:hypothetical protein